MRLVVGARGAQTTPRGPVRAGVGRLTATGVHDPAPLARHDPQGTTTATGVTDPIYEPPTVRTRRVVVGGVRQYDAHNRPTDRVTLPGTGVRPMVYHAPPPRRPVIKATAPRGDGHWVTMHGAHVWINADGQPQWTGTKTKPNTRWRFGRQLRGKAPEKGAPPTVPVRGAIAARPVPAHVVRWARGRRLPPHMGRLRIPPAWRDVRVNTDPRSSCWVTGVDSKGRAVVIQNPAFIETNQAAKFLRVQALDAEYAGVQRDLRKLEMDSDPRVREAAACLALINATGIRPDSEKDTKAKVRAYGATNLEGRHVTVVDGRVVLDYPGKHGVHLQIPVDDPRVAAMVLERARAAGPNGRLFATREAQVLAAAHRLDHGRFKTKDFRTRLGTHVAQELVASMPAPTNARTYQRAVNAVADAVAEKLGNTRAVALAKYIAPQVFEPWRGAAGV